MYKRQVFEEAAGISKYRHRKEESERKLERTEENLVRINDKIAELELQVDPCLLYTSKMKRLLRCASTGAMPASISAIICGLTPRKI